MLHVTFRFITLRHQNDYILNIYTVSEQDISLGISSFIISNIYTVFTTRRRRKKENLYSFRLPPATSFFRNLSFTALKQTKLRHVISINTERNLFQTEVQKLAKAIFLQLLSAFGTHARDHLERLLHNAKSYFSPAQQALSKSQSVGFLTVVGTTLSCKSLHDWTPR